jgi:hypothetical protein
VIERADVDNFFSFGTVLREREMDLLGNKRVAESGKKSRIVSKSIVSLHIYERPYN